jgi:hypothetical protein
MESVCFSNTKIEKINKHCYNIWLVVYEFRTHIWVGGHERGGCFNAVGDILAKLWRCDQIESSLPLKGKISPVS